MGAAVTHVRRGRRRRRRAARLYRQGLRPSQIAERMGVSVSSVWRYLQIEGVPPLYQAEGVLVLWPGRRPPHWALHVRFVCCEIVAGRKFCSGCGRWRHLADFPHDQSRGTPGKPLARCAACTRQGNRVRHQRTTARGGVPLERRRERQRFEAEGRRRRNGVVPTTAKRKNAVDRIEGIRLPVGPLLPELTRYEDGELTELANRAGISERALYRYRYGESQSVRIDVADRLAVAMGKTSSLIWAEVW